MVMQHVTESSRFDAATSGEGLVPAFQPIVALGSGRVAGYEALARWPASPELTPQRVFAAAAASGRLSELDVACRQAAVDAALAARLGTKTWLFVNVEPAALTASPGHDAVPRSALRDLSVVLELTERSLLARPAHLMREVEAARAAGCRIALDDLGTSTESLALLDVLMPEVIKLDLGLVQHTPRRDEVRALAAVIAHHERFGTTVLAEGVETEEHLEQALACGASLGQGNYFGRPGPLPAPRRTSRAAVLPVTTTRTPQAPFDLVADRPEVRTASKELLVAFSRHIEAQAVNPADPPVVLTALQHELEFSPATRSVYEQLARTSPLVAVCGVDLPAAPAGAVRGVTLAPDDPLVREWTVLVLGTQTAAALIARDRGDAVPEPQRRFDFLITYDRDLISAAARSVLARMT